jgi:hypothetical protein
MKHSCRTIQRMVTYAVRALADGRGREVTKAEDGRSLPWL